VATKIDRQLTRRKLPFHKVCEMVFTTDDGRRWHLEHMPFYVPIYDKPRSKLLLYTSRQSIKSTTLRNFSVGRCLKDAGSKGLVVAPTATQLRTFSDEKLDTAFSYRPELKDAFTTHETKWNVGVKEFRVGEGKSRITLRSTGGPSGAERIRGITANDIYLDELQSLLEEDIPVIESTAATFDGQDGRRQAFYVYAGTPLSKQNLIERQWARSKQYEWHIQCPHCSVGTTKTDPNGNEVRKGGWNSPLGMGHLDRDKPYLFCEHCGKDMYHPPWQTGDDRVPPRGTWVAHNPDGKFDGYRVVRMMMPWADWRSDRDDGILDRWEDWSERRFANEVMALAYDSGTIPITEDVVRDLCGDYELPKTEQRIEEVAKKFRGYKTYAGLDWAMQAKDEEVPSYTIFAVFARVHGKRKLIFAHRFRGQKSNDPEHVMKKLVRWIRLFQVDRVGADYGIGYKEDLRLMRIFGHRRIAAFQYKRSSGRARSSYDEQSLKWIIPKTRTLDQLIVDLENGEFELPRYEDAEPLVSDWYNLSIDMDPARRTIKYESTGPDDFVHAVNYAAIAERLHRRRGMFASKKSTMRSQRDRQIAGTPRTDQMPQSGEIAREGEVPMSGGEYPKEDDHVFETPGVST
jgi:hypothetical protein